MGALKIDEACRRTSGGERTGRFPTGSVERASLDARLRDFGSAIGVVSQVAEDAEDGFAVGAPYECKIGAFVPGT